MKVDWNKIQRIHIIGIGGVGISALARLLQAKDKHITATEDNDSPETTNDLRAQGVVISQDLEPSHVPEAECYIYSDAWLTKHASVLEEAKKRNVPVLSYFEALGSIANQYKVIAVSGTHGKTTTTAMLADVLEAGGLDPSSIVGSLRAKTNSNYRCGEGEYFVVEADEYRRHFLQFDPYIVVITNIDADHLDYYKDLTDIQSAFRELVERIPENGFLICDPNNPSVAPVIHDLRCHIVDYQTYFDPNLQLKVLPLHRINAAAVLAVADMLNISQPLAKETLEQFNGTWRRFEYKGETSAGALVYDDYGHHPTEVKTTLESAAAHFLGRRIFVAFIPHLYSRTKLLLKEFTESFDAADEIILAPIFAAREVPDETISSELLARKLQERGKAARAFSTFKEIEDYLREHTTEGDVIITMGAGNIYKVAESLTAI